MIRKITGPARASDLPKLKLLRSSAVESARMKPGFLRSFTETNATYVHIINTMTIPGIRAPENRSAMEVSVTTPYMINGRLGGMIMPKLLDAATVPEDISLL